MKFVVTLSNKGLATKTATYVEAHCFAEAASEAYLLRNNRNYSMGSGQGWWKIQSVSEAAETTKINNTQEDWGWSSEGEMT